jgi:hypothetical protein
MYDVNGRKQDITFDPNLKEFNLSMDVKPETYILLLHTNKGLEIKKISVVR